MRDGLVVRRSLQVAHALLVVAAAYTGALAVGASVGMWLDSDAGVVEPSSPMTVATGAGERGRRQSDVAIIFKRNLFASEPFAASDTEPGVTIASLDLKLRGTARVEGREYAVFEDSGETRQDVFAVGERVFDGPKLVSVTEHDAVLLYQGRKRTITISKPKTDVKGKETTGGIRKTGATSYLVDRREVEHTLENLNTVITQMRAVPYLRDGKSLGFRVFNIRPGSIFEQMGLKNGDVIQRVNGTELNSPSNAMGLLDTIADADEIRVDLLRGDEAQSLSYRIQ